MQRVGLCCAANSLEDARFINIVLIMWNFFSSFYCRLCGKCDCENSVHKRAIKYFVCRFMFLDIIMYVYVCVCTFMSLRCNLYIEFSCWLFFKKMNSFLWYDIALFRSQVSEGESGPDWHPDLFFGGLWLSYTHGWLATWEGTKGHKLE